MQFLNKCGTSVRTVENSGVLSNGCGSVRKALNAMESFFMSHINRRNHWPKSVNLLIQKTYVGKERVERKICLKLKPQITLWTWFLTLKYIVVENSQEKRQKMSSSFVSPFHERYSNGDGREVHYIPLECLGSKTVNILEKADALKRMKLDDHMTKEIDYSISIVGLIEVFYLQGN